MSVKTLHITNWWAETSGGIATFYRELLLGAEEAQREIRLIVPGPVTRTERHGRYGVIYHVKAARSPFSAPYRVLTPLHYLLPGSPVREILDAERPGVVECCDKYTLNYLAALLRRGWLLGRNYRPVVLGLSCERMDRSVSQYVSRGKWAEALCRGYMKWLLFPMFDHHIAVSEVTAAELRHASIGHMVRRGVWVRPMGADCRHFRTDRRTPAKRRWVETLTGASEGASLLLYAGRLAPEKNLGLLAGAMMRLDPDARGEFHLVVAGDGPLRRPFEAACYRELPGGVCFLGHIENREMLADLLANCDVFLHPNPHEPYGLAPLEAMASGLALVAPNSGGVTTFANGGNAWVVEPTAAAFAEAVREIRGSPDTAAARIRAARAAAEQYDSRRMIAGYFELYDELHELLLGGRAEPRLCPAFYSTAGNRFGWEIE